MRTMTSEALVVAGLLVGLGSVYAGCSSETDGTRNGSEAPGSCVRADDDGNPCTVDTCSNEQSAHFPVSDGTGCAIGRNQGVCQGGQCKLACESVPQTCACDKATDCPQSSFCLVWLCDANICKQIVLQGAVLDEQIAGDCKERVCGADGNETLLSKDTDVPAPSNACHIGVCDGGQPVQEPIPKGMQCSDGAGVCDDDGQCVPCIEGTNEGCAAGEQCCLQNGVPACNGCK